MIEQETTNTQELQFANSLLAWFQSGDEAQQPRLLTLDACQRLEAAGICSERLQELRASLHTAGETEQISLWLHFSGFSAELVDQLLDGKAAERIKDSLQLLRINNPGLFEDNTAPAVTARVELPTHAHPTRRSTRAMGAAASGMQQPKQDDGDIAEEGDTLYGDNSLVRLKSVVRNEGDEDDPAPVLGERALSTDLVGIYLQEIGKTPLLNAEEEVQLSKMIEAGLYAQHLLDADDLDTSLAMSRAELTVIAEQGKSAKQHMIQANLRLVVSVAKRKKYQGKGLEPLELMAEGNIGLIRAVEKFDYTKGYKFSTYATWWIKQALDRGLANAGDAIRLPVHMKEKLKRIQSVQAEILRRTGEEPNLEELAAECGLPEAQVRQLLEHERTIISLDQPLLDRKGDPSDTLFGDIHAVQADSADELVHNTVMKETAEGLLGFLDARSAHMVSMRHGLAGGGREFTLEEIGRAHGMTRERVRQIINKANVNMRARAARTGFDKTVSGLLNDG